MNDVVGRLCAAEDAPKVGDVEGDGVTENVWVDPTTHELKAWPEYFDAIADGRKLFELRKNDRNYRVGDNLKLKRWDPKTESYTGAEIEARVSYLVTGGSFGLPNDMCVMGLRILWVQDPEPAYDCHRCFEEIPNRKTFQSRMILCPTCGNKRCPRASDHRLTCTNSNEPGQPGSVYA